MRIKVTGKKLRGAALTAMALLFPAAFLSCGTDNEPTGIEDSECRMIVRLQASPAGDRTRGGATRAEKEAEETSGNAALSLPTSIDEGAVKSLYLSVVTDDNKVIPLASRYIRKEGETYLYEAILNVDGEYVSYTPAEKRFYFDGRIMAMANMPDTPWPHPVNCEPYPLSYVAEQGAIPMWGVTKIESLELKVGAYIDAGTEISLLRSLPKFTFTLSSSLGDVYRIAKVEASTSDYGYEALCQPKGSIDCDFTLNMTAEDAFYPKPIMSWTGAPELIYGAGGREVTLYTAERELPGISGFPRWFNVTLERTDGTGQPIVGKIYLCDYEQGKPDFDKSFDKLIRNHDYRYEISLAELTFVVSFKEWIYGGKVHIGLE